MDFDIKYASYETTYLIPYRSAVLLRPVLAVVLDQPVVQCVDPSNLIKVKINLSSCSTSLIKNQSRSRSKWKRLETVMLACLFHRRLRRRRRGGSSGLLSRVFFLIRRVSSSVNMLRREGASANVKLMALLVAVMGNRLGCKLSFWASLLLAHRVSTERMLTLWASNQMAVKNFSVCRLVVHNNNIHSVGYSVGYAPES